MTYHTYIIFSPSKNTFYVGHTSDLYRRLNEHNSGINKSTKNAAPWNLMFTREFNSRSEAMKFESKIKRMKSRKYIEQLIAES
jgi:putative endonuclease